MSIPTITPLFAGDKSIARAIVRGGENNAWLVLGDSIVYDGGGRAPFNDVKMLNAILRRWPVPILSHFWNMRIAALLDSSGNWTTADVRPPTAYDSPVSGALGRIGTYAPFGSTEASFLGGTPGSDTRTGSDDLDTSDFQARIAQPAGVDVGILFKRSERLGIIGKVRQVVYQHATGPVGANLYNKCRILNTVQSTSAAYTARNATAGYLAVDNALTPPFLDSGVGLEGRGFSLDNFWQGGNVASNGTTFVTAGTWYSTGEAGFGMHCLGVPGADADYWLDVNNFSVAAWNSLVPMLGFTGLILALGINNHGSDSPSAYAAKLTTLITRFRVGVPDGPVMIIAPHATADTGMGNDPNAGGEGYEDAIVAELCALAEATDNCFFVNMNRSFGPTRIHMNSASGDLGVDNVHPTSPQGYAAYVDLWWGILRSASVLSDSDAVDYMTIPVRNKLNGVLTDAASVEFTNPEGTFGLRRTDTGEIILAASVDGDGVPHGVTLTRSGVGLYYYTLQDTAPRPPYEYWIKITQLNGASTYIRKITRSESGPGADDVTVTLLKTGTTDPIVGADVWITSDSAGASVVAGTLQTDSNGQATFLLSAGTTYYLWMQKDGEEPIRGSQFIAVAD